MPFLEQLWLSYNELSGKLPESMGQCASLQKLYLQTNKGLVCLFGLFFVLLHIHLPVCLPVCVIQPSIHPSIRLSACLPACLSACLPVPVCEDRITKLFTRGGSEAAFTEFAVHWCVRHRYQLRAA